MFKKPNSTSDENRMRNLQTLSEHSIVTSRLAAAFRIVEARETDLAAANSGDGWLAEKAQTKCHTNLADAERKLHNEIEKELRNRGLPVAEGD